MIIDIECPVCNGVGRVHSSGRSGDPMDDGENCPRCEGTGCVAHDLNEDADDG
jgi:DnaJ-class molecular chaperone